MVLSARNLLEKPTTTPPSLLPTFGEITGIGAFFWWEAAWATTPASPDAAAGC